MPVAVRRRVGVLSGSVLGSRCSIDSLQLGRSLVLIACFDGPLPAVFVGALRAPPSVASSTVGTFKSASPGLGSLRLCFSLRLWFQRLEQVRLVGLSVSCGIGQIDEPARHAPHLIE